MAAELHGADELRKRIKRAGPEILEAIGPVLVGTASQILTFAQVDVPSDSGGLAASAFTDGPEIKGTRVSASCGYTADHAPYAHEGFHYGRKAKTPPKWLEKAANGREQKLADEVGRAIRSTLERIAR